MIKRNLRIAKDYFSLVTLKNKYLIIFTVVDTLNVLVSLLIPLWASMIVDKISLEMYDSALFYVLLLGCTYLFLRIGSYSTNWCYANFFKEAYVEVHSKLVNSIYHFDEEFTKKISIGKIVNSSNEDIINISEVPSLLIEFFVELIKLIAIYIILIKQSPCIAIYVIIVGILYYYFSNQCNKKITYYLKRQRNCADKITGMLSQILVGLKDIKTFGIFEKLNNKLDCYRKKWQK